MGRDKAIRTASTFWDNKQDATIESPEIESQKKMQNLAEAFIQTEQGMTDGTEEEISLEKKKNLAENYLLNGDELTERNENVTADAERKNRFSRFIDSKQDIIAEPESNDGTERRIKTSAQFIAIEIEVTQSDAHPINKQHQETLRDFMKAEEGVVTKSDSVTEDAQRRQQTIAQQSFDNQELIVEPSDEEKLMQKLMQEQKEIRDRSHQKRKRRSR